MRSGAARSGERSAAHDDPHRDGVSPTLCAARPPAGFCAHSAVWLSRQWLSYRAPGARPHAARPAVGARTIARHRGRARCNVVLPSVRHAHDRRAHPHELSARGGLSALRYVMIARPHTDHRRHARTCYPRHAPRVSQPIQPARGQRRRTAPAGQMCRLPIRGAIHMRPSGSFLHLGLRLVAP